VTGAPQLHSLFLVHALIYAAAAFFCCVLAGWPLPSIRPFTITLGEPNMSEFDFAEAPARRRKARKASGGLLGCLAVVALCGVAGVVAVVVVLAVVLPKPHIKARPAATVTGTVHTAHWHTDRTEGLFVILNHDDGSISVCDFDPSEASAVLALRQGDKATIRTGPQGKTVEVDGRTTRQYDRCSVVK